jgi:hypothetical protein
VRSEGQLFPGPSKHKFISRLRLRLQAGFVFLTRNRPAVDFVLSIQNHPAANPRFDSRRLHRHVVGLLIHCHDGQWALPSPPTDTSPPSVCRPSSRSRTCDGDCASPAEPSVATREADVRLSQVCDRMHIPAPGGNQRSEHQAPSRGCSGCDSIRAGTRANLVS